MPIIWGWYERQLNEEIERGVDLDRQYPTSQDDYEARFAERYRNRQKNRDTEYSYERPGLGGGGQSTMDTTNKNLRNTSVLFTILIILYMFLLFLAIGVVYI